ncbi:uncharacterized protein LOC129538371 [Moschus berezovskii]|uniref:uncharacterized protein LOC129538371 n=1 Tax=Moschus berezovskii TaxID=68408 RepID=UPI002443F9EB|nr:uncharacterized protein LOC129538371 [Moschus berezovskii]
MAGSSEAPDPQAERHTQPASRTLGSPPLNPARDAGRMLPHPDAAEALDAARESSPRVGVGGWDPLNGSGSSHHLSGTLNSAGAHPFHLLLQCAPTFRGSHAFTRARAVVQSPGGNHPTRARRLAGARPPGSVLGRRRASSPGRRETLRHRLLRACARIRSVLPGSLRSAGKALRKPLMDTRRAVLQLWRSHLCPVFSFAESGSPTGGPQAPPHRPPSYPGPRSRPHVRTRDTW